MAEYVQKRNERLTSKDAVGSTGVIDYEDMAYMSKWTVSLTLCLSVSLSVFLSAFFKFQSPLLLVPPSKHLSLLSTPAVPISGSLIRTVEATARLPVEVIVTMFPTMSVSHSVLPTAVKRR